MKCILVILGITIFFEAQAQIQREFELEKLEQKRKEQELYDYCEYVYGTWCLRRFKKVFPYDEKHLDYVLMYNKVIKSVLKHFENIKRCMISPGGLCVY